MSLPHGEDLSVTAQDEAFKANEDFGTSRIKQCALNPDPKVPQYSVDPQQFFTSGVLSTSCNELGGSQT